MPTTDMKGSLQSGLTDFTFVLKHLFHVIDLQHTIAEKWATGLFLMCLRTLRGRNFFANLHIPAMHEGESEEAWI